MRAPVILAALSLVAALIHASVAPDHLTEMWQHGLFMLAATAGQGAGALLLPSGRRWVLALTIAGNTLILAVALVAYTSGLPAWLPGADGAEPWTWQVAACDALEAALIGGCLWQWYTWTASQAPTTGPGSPPPEQGG